MREKVKRLLERFPERADTILHLFDSDTRFRDLIGDHHDVSEALLRRGGDGHDADPAEAEALKRRQADLEEELLLAMQNHQRI